MIIVRVCGGLGNQLSAIAFYEQLKTIRKDVFLDLRNYSLCNEHGGYEIEKIFGLQYPTVGEITVVLNANMHILHEYSGIRKIPGRLSKLAYDRIEPFRKKIDATHLCEDHSKEDFYILNLLERKKNIYLDGSWNRNLWRQSIDVRSLFRFSSKYLEIYKSEIDTLLTIGNTCSIHVRGGDYKGNAYFEKCKNDWFEKAIAIAKEKIPSVKFILFTDDIEYAHEILPADMEYSVVENRGVSNAGDDLFLMSCCTNHIMSNSTYAYWGAILSDDNGITIAPSITKKWFGDSPNRSVIYIDET